MRITSVEKSKMDKEKLEVYCENELLFTIGEEDYLRYGLYEEKELSWEKIQSIKENVQYREAKLKSIRFLARRLRTSGEVMEMLGREGYDKDTIEYTINYLKSNGYIDDKNYATKYIMERLKLKPKSINYLKYELKSKGIGEEVIDEIVEQMDFDEEKLIKELIIRKFGTKELKNDKVVKKIYTFLWNRGFSQEKVAKCIQEIDYENE